jgi:hypothetical protein
MKRFFTRRNLLTVLMMAIIFTFCTAEDGCDDDRDSSKATQVQAAQQEQLEQQSNSVAGMPAITNFREKKLLKSIFEMRDQAIPTYTYVYSQMQGKFTYMGSSIGYGIPYATQYTNPEQLAWRCSQGCGSGVIPQADPNGLYSPADAEGTWVLLLDDTTGKVSAQYMEERINVFDHKLPDRLVIQ